jgi:hypothetical protein
MPSPFLQQKVVEATKQNEEREKKPSFFAIAIQLSTVVITFWWDVRREFMQRLSTALHGTLGSYLRDALQEGSAGAVACLPVPRAKAETKVFSSFLYFAWWSPLFFLVRILRN